MIAYNFSAQRLYSSRFIFLFSLTLPAFTKRTVAPDSSLIKEDATGLPMEASPQSKKDDYESKNSKM